MGARPPPSTPANTHSRIFGIPRGPRLYADRLCVAAAFGARTREYNFEKQITPFSYILYTCVCVYNRRYQHNSCAVNLIIIPSRYNAHNPFVASDNLCTASVSDIIRIYYIIIIYILTRPRPATAVTMVTYYIITRL